MYDIDRPKFVFISLLEEFVRETEHSLAYFFALMVFLLTFLLALFGKEALYTGLIGVLCLFLIKLRDFIEGFQEIRTGVFFPPFKEKKALQRFQDIQPVCDDMALSSMAKEFPDKFKEKESFSADKNEELFSYLKTCWKTIETVSLFFPDCPFRPETKRVVKKMTEAAHKYLLHYLKKKYDLTQEQAQTIEKNYDADMDLFLMQTQLESFGIDEKTALWSVKIIELLKKINLYMEADKTSEEAAFLAASSDQKLF